MGLLEALFPPVHCPPPGVAKSFGCEVERRGRPLSMSTGRASEASVLSVLRVIAAGAEVRTAEIIEATGLSPSTVNVALRGLLLKGVVQREWRVDVAASIAHGGKRFSYFYWLSGDE